VCDDFIRELRDVPRKHGIALPDRQLVCAPVQSPEGGRYLAAMRAAANFAWCNRQLLATQIRKTMERFFGQRSESLGLRQVYDVAHNIAKIETHMVEGHERRLCVHRKGATRAFPPGHPELPEAFRAIGQPVLIPGSMGTASYLLAGVESGAETLWSTNHGAGRVLSRTAAAGRRGKGGAVSESDFRRAMQGIELVAADRRGVYEEAPQAYKDIDAVVEVVVGAGLARAVARMKPLAVLKG
jgi:tRNA-splicing ligase RtcB